MSTLLGLVETPGQYQELIRLAEALKAQAQVSQLYLVHDCGPATPQIIEGFERAGAGCIAADGATVNQIRRLALGGAPSWWRTTARFLRNTFRPAYLLFTYRRLFRHRKIDLVVVTEDSVAARSRALIATASRAGVPVLILPFTIPNPYEAARILGRRPDYQVHGWLARVFARLRPNWILEAPEGRLIRLPLPQAIMNELTRLAPARPWIDNDGPATIAVESQAMVKHYRALGLADRQLVLTGSLADHILERSLTERTQRRAELRARFQLSDKPILLCAMPPDQLTHAGAVSEFKSYRDLMTAWTAALTSVADKFAVVVRPHPRLDDSMIGSLRQAGLTICWDDTATLVPLCDLYVASISATIRWAIACGRPVVNYDVFQYRFDDYEGVPGNINVNDIAAFNQALADLAGRPEQLAAMTLAQSSVVPDWGCLDGESNRRIQALVARLLVPADRAP
jgi:hypothetical protein